MENQAWENFMKSRRGKWTVDVIHNGKDGQDLWVYRPLPSDQTQGDVITLLTDGRAFFGTFKYAIPHIGDAVFDTHNIREFENFEIGKSQILFATR